jgi:hypothetical protein
MANEERAAAVLEEHGSIQITRTMTGPFARYALQVAVWGADTSNLHWLLGQFGGQLDVHQAPTRLGWRVTSRKAMHLLRLVLPRLSRLRTAAELGIAFQEQRASTGLPATDAYRERQDGFYRRMRRLTAGQWRQDGERNGSAKLTARQVAVIRRRAAAGTAGRQLADEFKVAESTISMIAHGRSW